MFSLPYTRRYGSSSKGRLVMSAGGSFGRTGKTGFAGFSSAAIGGGGGLVASIGGGEKFFSFSTIIPISTMKFSKPAGIIVNNKYYHLNFLSPRKNFIDLKTFAPNQNIIQQDNVKFTNSFS